jgi:heat shock protein HslJ
MIIRLLTILVGASLSVLPLAGCGSTESEPESDAAQTSAPAAVHETSTELLAHEWHLEAFGKLGEEDEVAPGTSITLSFDKDGRLSGSGGCNRYSTTFKTGPSGEIAVRALATTQKECDAETSERELAYFTAFADVSSFNVGADQLQLFYGEDEYALIFRGEPRDEAETGD